MMVQIIAVAILIAQIVSLTECTISLKRDLEAEEGLYTGTLVPRHSASGDFTVSLQEGEYIQHLFTIHADCVVYVDDVVYRSDGPEILINITLAQVVGHFTTDSGGSGMDLLNTVHNSGPVGEALQLSQGSYQFSLTAIRTNEREVEIDKSTLNFNCDEDPKITINRNDDDDFGSDNGLTRSEIIAIAGTVITAVIGIPTCIATIFSCCACC